MLFNLNHGLKQPEFDNIDCKIVETKVPISSELINDCKIQSSMNENEMNFQYLDVLDVEFSNLNFETKEAVLHIDENGTERCSNVTPQKYPRIFIIILLYIPILIEPNLGFSRKTDKF